MTIDHEAAELAAELSARLAEVRRLPRHVRVARIVYAGRLAYLQALPPEARKPAHKVGR